MNDKSVILIGNGFCLKDSNLGKEIDEFDEIIRINDWKTVGYETDAGTKTTVWTIYNPLKGMINFKNSYIDMGYDPIPIAKGINEIWYVCWNPNNIMNSWKNNTILKELQIYDKVKRHISISTSKKIRRMIDPPSTGFSLIWILTHMYKRIYITGFDFWDERYKDEKYHHYYGKKLRESVKNRGIHHMDKEYELVQELITEGKIQQLDRSQYISRSKFRYDSIECRVCDTCGNTSNMYPWEQPICHYCESKI